MKFVLFYHSLVSDWNHGNAHFLRGVVTELLDRGHEVEVFEPEDGWSYSNLRAEQGDAALQEFHEQFPHLTTRFYDLILTYGGGPPVVKAYQALGARQCVPIYYAWDRDLHDLPGGRLVLYPDWETIRPVAEAELSDADVGLVTSYCSDGVAATELLADTAGPLRVFYDLDTPVTLNELNRSGTVSYLGPSGLADFDLVLSYTGGMALEALHERLGARRVAPLYGSVDPQVHRPVSPQDRYRNDLSYLGTYAADRQAKLEQLLIEPARRLPERRFFIGGAQYPAAFPWTDNIFFVGHCRPPDHPAFFSSSRMTLNITRADMAAMGYCPSGRLFEAAACGTPILSDTWEGLESFYTPGKELLVVETTEDVVSAMELSDAELNRIATAARERTLEEYTADKRAAELLYLLNDTEGQGTDRYADVSAVSV